MPIDSWGARRDRLLPHHRGRDLGLGDTLMGLGIFRPSGGGAPSGCQRPSGGVPRAPEPNPAAFTIRATTEINGWTIVLAHYPGCTTYEGTKLLVYPCSRAVVLAQARLDPHFGERAGELFPVARLEPTDRGRDLALLICRTRAM